MNRLVILMFLSKIVNAIMLTAMTKPVESFDPKREKISKLNTTIFSTGNNLFCINCSVSATIASIGMNANKCVGLEALTTSRIRRTMKVAKADATLEPV